MFPYRLYLKRLKLAKLDIRAVRGPKTRECLRKIGIVCPENYGDPAVLMPEIYKPTIGIKQYDVSLITHFSQNSEYNNINLHRINMLTTDFRYVINEICKSKKIISSSLHGIILAEVYNVPAVFLSQEGNTRFKFEDYYLSTNRENIIAANTIEEALKLVPMPIPSFDIMRERLKKSFPLDLWGNQFF